jgi:hypothetical protein
MFFLLSPHMYTLATRSSCFDSLSRAQQVYKNTNFVPFVFFRRFKAGIEWCICQEVFDGFLLMIFEIWFCEKTILNYQCVSEKMRAVLNWPKMQNQGLEFRKETRELTKWISIFFHGNLYYRVQNQKTSSGVLNFWRSLHLYHEPILLGKRIRKLYVFQMVVWECGYSCFLKCVLCWNLSK